MGHKRMPRRNPKPLPKKPANWAYWNGLLKSEGMGVHLPPLPTKRTSIKNPARRKAA